jgi:hypothetical protein
MSWDRHTVATALVSVLGAATEGAVKIHPLPPEIVNPMAVVVHRPQPVTYGAYAFGVDEATLPLVIVGGIETEEAIDTLKSTCRFAIIGDPTLGGAVSNCFPTEERNWRNYTGAGGIQILQCELVLTVTM